MAYVGENFPRYLASAYASNGLFRAAVGGAFPLFATPMFKRLTLQGGCSLLGGLAVLLIPVTAAFYYYGPKLRAASRRAGYLEQPDDKADASDDSSIVKDLDPVDAA